MDAPSPTPRTFAGQRVTLMGLGRHGGGVAAARYLVEQGARVTVTDLADEAALADSIRELADVPIAAWHLGGHREEDLRKADWIVVNPAVKPDQPLVRLAVESGARITSETELFLDSCPAIVVGVTGSNGKSSTVSMMAAILEAAGRRTWLGGNIGRSLLPDLPRILPEDVVVLELSSFQLHWLSPHRATPPVAIITNCTPNHLDWHGTMEHYIAAKQRLLTCQPALGSLAVLNDRDAEVSTWRSLVRGTCLTPLADDLIPPLPVVGSHQRANAACVAAAALGLGCSMDAIRSGLANFRGLPHRIEFVAEHDGRLFYNDSKSTTPESTIAALASFDRPVWLMAGGYDKGVDYRALVAAIATNARGAAFYGAVGDTLQRLTLESSPAFECCAVKTLAEALAWCRARSQRGDAILLSPACASFDQFRDYQERGERFAALVRATSY